MKALVLSGGMGTRLRPLTHSMPKQLVPVAGVPVLLRSLADLRDCGVSEVAIVVGHWGKEIEAAVGAAELGLQVTYLYQAAPFGLAHCVHIARDFLGEDDFVMYLADNLYGGGITAHAREFLRDRPVAQLVVRRVANPVEYGVAELDGTGRVVQLWEKPAHPVSDLAITGTYFFTPAIHEAVRNIEPSARGEWEITDALQWLVTEGAEIRAVEHTGYWCDTGRIEDLLDGNRELMTGMSSFDHGTRDAASSVSGAVRIHPGARLIRSTVEGPAIVGPDTVLEDSYVGPFTALGADCLLRGAGIEDSIVLDGVSVHDVLGIHQSVIGRGAEVTQSAAPARRRLALGDHAHVELPA